MAVCLGTAWSTAGQYYAAPPPAPAIPLRSSTELDQMTGPIALYPDPLIAQILPAATLPAQVVMADRFVQSGQDLNLVDQQPWDPSIKALARYPSVLKMMDDNISWTTDLGQAFLAQPGDVMDSIQRLRAQAQAMGNLYSTPQQQVIVQPGAIEILPANPQVIYVPVYQPSVVFYRPPPPTGFWITFGAGFGIGAWLNHDCDWHHHDVIVWHRDHPRPSDWWFRSPRERVAPVVIGRTGASARRDVTVWHPRTRSPLSPVERMDRGWEVRENRPQFAEAARPTPAPRATLPEARRISPPVRESRPISRPPRVESQPMAPVRPAPTPRSAPPVTQVPPAVRESRPVYYPPRVESRPVAPSRPTTPIRPATPAVSSARPWGGAYVGVQSARETSQFSRRGQESRQAFGKPAAVATRPAAPAPTRSTSSPRSKER